MQKANRPRRIDRLFSGTVWLLSMIILCATLSAQNDRTISVRMLDSKTGQPISTSEIDVMVRASGVSTQAKGIPPVSVRPNREGIGVATFPTGASDIRAYALYGKANWSYVNCDSIRDQGSAQEHWYSISEILATGIALPNFCSNRKVAVKPGEFVFFVRPMSFWEKMHE
jgi:hypothetical protein